jgi:hypothetical protein
VNQRTYSAKDWEAAEEAWRAGTFHHDTWGWLRKAGRERGLLYPPAGAPNEEGTQRAVLLAAMDEDPDLLRFAVGHGSVTSWANVISIYVDERRLARQAAEQAERQYLAEKRSYGSQQDAARSLAGILQVLADSVGTSPPVAVAAGSAVVAYQQQLWERWRSWHHSMHTTDGKDDATNDAGLCVYDSCRMMRHILEVPMDEG